VTFWERVVDIAPLLPVVVAAWWIERKTNAWGRRRKAARRARRLAIREQAKQEGIGRAATWAREMANEARFAWQDARAAFEKTIGKRLFKDDLGKWPVVRSTRAGRLVMKAPYIGPRRVQNFGGWKPPVLTGAAVAVLYWLVYRHISPTPEDLAGATAGAAIYCGLFSIPLWRLARKTRLRIRFIDGAMIWRGPDWKRYVVKPGEDRRVEALEQHRWAAEEARIQAQWQATHPGRGIPKPLFQTSSELLLITRRGGRAWMPVAEFVNDLGGERALMLKNAIDFVTENAAEELAARARAEAEAGEL
jgi:hypothetical protein